VLNNSNRIVKVLAGVAGMNLTLALAVSAGAVPHPGADSHVRTASVELEELAAPVRQPGDAVAPARVEAPAAAANVVTIPAPATTAVAKAKAITPPATEAPAG